jgi:hypothetical protein
MEMGSANQVTLTTVTLALLLEAIQLGGNRPQLLMELGCGVELDTRGIPVLESPSQLGSTVVGRARGAQPHLDVSIPMEGLYQKHGTPLLLLSAVPVLGPPPNTAAGAVGIGRTKFLIWVFIGKLVRNWLLVLFVYVGIDLLGFLNSKVLGREPFPDKAVPDSPQPGFFSQLLLSRPLRQK